MTKTVKEIVKEIKEKMDRAAAVLRESRLAKTVFATDVF